MAPDFVELLAHHGGRHVRIMQMALLDRLARGEVVIVLPRLDVVIRIRAEEVSVNIRVDGGLRLPLVPKSVAERVCDEFPFLATVVVVHAHGRRLGVGVLGRIGTLGLDNAEMFAPDVSAERGGVEAGLVGFPVHGGLDGAGVGHDDTEFAVVRAHLRSVVQVAGPADHGTVIHDEQFRVDVQFFLDEVGLLVFRVAFPGLFGHEAATGHGVLGDAFGRCDGVFDVELVPGGLEFPLAVNDTVLFVFAGTRARATCFTFSPLALVSVDPAAHDLFGLGTLELLVRDSGFFFLLDQRRGLVDPIVRAQIEHKNVLRGVEAGLGYLSTDALFAAMDGFVLVIHDGTGTDGGVVAEVARETWDGGNDNDDAEFAAFLAGTHAGVDDGTANGIVYGLLFLPGRRDEKLILNVDVVLGILDDFGVCILDAVVIENATGPVVAATNELCMHTTRVLKAFGLERAKWMLDVFADWMFGALDRDQVFVLVGAVGSCARGHAQIVDAFVALVFVAFDKVPAKDEMFGDVDDTFTDQTHGHIVPGHTAVVGLVEFVVGPI